MAELISKGKPLLEGTDWGGTGNEEWEQYFRAWEARNYANLMEYRQRKAEEEMRDKRRWEEEERAEEAKAEERAWSSSTAESQGMQGAMPPVYAATSQATGEQGAMPPASSSGAEQLPHEVPKGKSPCACTSRL